jgi:hypothetical protein
MAIRTTMGRELFRAGSIPIVGKGPFVELLGLIGGGPQPGTTGDLVGEYVGQCDAHAIAWHRSVETMGIPTTKGDAPTAIGAG